MGTTRKNDVKEDNAKRTNTNNTCLKEECWVNMGGFIDDDDVRACTAGRLLKRKGQKMYAMGGGLFYISRGGRARGYTCTAF